MKKEYDFRKGKRGAVLPVPTGKTRVTIRLDDDLSGLVPQPGGQGWGR